MTLTAGLLLVLTACLGGSDEPEIKGPVGDLAPTPSPSTATLKQHGGPAGGFTIGLPEGWQIVDPTTSSLDAVRTAFGIKGGELPELVEATLDELKKHNAVFAVETASLSTGYANHLTAVCAPGGAIGNDLDTLKRKSRALNGKHQGYRLTDVTVSGKPGLRASYTSTKSTGVTEDEVEIQVPGTGDKVCETQITTKQGAPAKDTEQILASFKIV
ncbi:hypothetical protein SAMN04489712_11230 [Thermomonospora echinospora]|uniref:Lipoprotein n=2 Tax=Thermomonospora echinospora TaxID=1992 RepID=A0A1H6CYI5_9ACTN|nr:hypothetical protein SAMN04489712_11230 [Thermomonospora echinospora]